MLGIRLNAQRVRAWVPFATLTGLVAWGCHNTWQGVKEDTHQAVQKTGDEMEKAGKKLKGEDEKKPTNPPANEDDGGAPQSDR